ncbi:MAG TPA: protein kinase [Myxococcota bacterium]|jgi:serine/threonine protein kinase/tetratricopeptide (TPR) repeat protein|nr:protein kinase [Myxococcota bacterium]
MESQVFGKFHLLAHLAHGGISDIYKVKTTGVAGFEKVQVLKRIRSELSSDQRFISAFAREAQVAVSLNHRNIVQVYEFGRVGPDYFLAMEYVEGVDLGRLMAMRARGSGPVPLGLALHLAAEVAAGLDYAHSKSDYGGGALGVVHGDLAPNHVLLSYDGSVKILDFGIARAALERAVALGGVPMGRPGYMAPEQTRGEPVTPRSDIYVIGVLLYELLVGRSPFPGETPDEVLQSASEGLVVPASDPRPDLPPAALQLLERALGADPEDRYVHARDLVRDVLQIQRAASEIHNTRTVRDFLVGYVGDSGQKIPPDLQPGGWFGASIVPAPAGGVVAAAGTSPTIVPSPDGTFTSPQIRMGDDDDSQSTTDNLRLERRAASTRPGAAPPPGADTAQAVAAKSRHSTARAASGAAAAAAVALDEDDADDTSRQRPLSRVSDAGARAGRHGPSAGVVAAAGPEAVPGAGVPAGAQTARAAVPVENIRTTRPFPMPAAARVAPAASAPSERKPIVVVHVEPTGVDDVASLLPTGPTVADVRADLRTLLEGMAYRAGGVVAAQSDVGLTVTFGLPVASEDDHEVAVRFALDALEACHGTARDLLSRAGMSLDGSTPPLTLHAGVRAGTARLRGGAGEAMTFSVLGDAAEVAEGLCRLAAPGTILVAGPTVAMTRKGYSYREGPAVPSRGGAAARAHFLLGARSQAERRRGLRAGGRMMVGRDLDLARVVAAYHEAVAAVRPRGLLVTGAAGIGKSRLVLEFAEQIAGEATVLQGVCRFFSSGSPYAVWVDLLRDHLGIGAGDDPLRVRMRLEKWLRDLLPDRAEVDFVRTALLDFLAPSRRMVAATTHPGEGDTEDRQRTAFRAVLRVLAALGERRPIVVLAEDVQWVDATSEQLLRQLLERHPGPLLLLATCRPADVPRALAEIPALELGPLDEGAQRQMLVDLLGASRSAGALAEEVMRKAGGSPFFLCELAEALRDAWSAAGEGGRAAPPLVTVPVTVRGAVVSRVDRLTPAAKRVLQRAAVVGQAAPASLLEALGGSDQGTEEALREVVSRGLLLREASQAGEASYAFHQSIVQEVVYDSLGDRERRALHHDVGERLAAVLGGGDADAAAAVARHFERAGAGARAGQFYLKAAAAAAAVYANAEALAFYDRAYRELAADPALEMEILAGKERIHAFMGLADEEARELDAIERIARARQHLGWLAEVLVRRSEMLRTRGEIDGARRAAMEAVEAAVRTDDPVVQGRAEKEMGEIYSFAGDIEGALERYRKALRWFEAAGVGAQLWRVRQAMGTAHLMSARYADAEVEFQRALDEASRVGDDFGVASAVQALGASSYCMADWETCLQRFGEALEMGRRLGNRRSEGVNLSNIGLVHAELGLYDGAHALLQQARAIYEEVGGGANVVDTAIWQGLVERRRGDRTSARRFLNLALDTAEQLGHVYWTVMARLGLALHHVEGPAPADWEKALKVADEAVAQAREATLVHGVIQGQSRAGWALWRLGRLDEARQRSEDAAHTLQEQRIVECSEEEVYFTHHRVLAALGESHAEEAARYLELAARGLQEKAARIKDPARRTSFLGVPLHREILALAGGATGPTSAGEETPSPPPSRASPAR